MAYLGLGAFSAPLQQPGGGKAEGRMLYTAILYTPDKGRSHYLVDFDLDRLAAQMRQAATAPGSGAARKVVGARLKQSGMRRPTAGAARVAPLRALYLSGPEVGDTLLGAGAPIGLFTKMNHPL